MIAIKECHSSSSHQPVEAFVIQHWKAAWKQHLALPESALAEKADESIETFLRSTTDGTIFYALDEHGNIVGSIVCQHWKGPVPIEVVDRAALSIGTLWGFHVAKSECENEMAIRKMLLQRALQHLRNVLQCHKVVVLALSSLETEAYKDCGFESKNMMTLSLSNDQAAVNTLLTTGSNVNTTTFRIQKEGPESDSIVVNHWREMWQDVGIPKGAIATDMDNLTMDFISNARECLQYQTFVARRDSDGRVLGSVSCQVWQGPCPQVAPSHRVGTVWAVYVQNDVRRQGIATALMKSMLSYLVQIGCTDAVLFAASDAGQRVYEKLGFAPNNALVLDISKTKEMQLTEELAERLQAVGVSDFHTSVVSALVTATTQQLDAVFVFDGHPQQKQIIDTIIRFQVDNDLYIDPLDNWFTQNVKKFGKGFDIKKLQRQEPALVEKFDRLAPTYDHWTVGNQSKVERFIVLCTKKLLNGTRKESGNLCVMDLACGIGLQGQIMRLCGFQGMIVGNDVSPGMIARVMERGCYNQAFVANANHCIIDKDDTKFDVVICTGAMELLDQAAALCNISSAMKTGGEAWLSFQHESVEAGVQKDSTRHQNISGITKAKVEQLLTEAGLHAVAMELCPDAFYTPSPDQDGSLCPVPYIFVVARKL